MRQSLPGLFFNAERALRSSSDDHACASAHSLGELVDNLRVLKDGGCTVEEFFKVYVFDSQGKGKLADYVRPERFDCMRDEEDEEDEDA